MNIFLEFFLIALIILFTGINLTKYGDLLAEKTGLGKSWVGLVLLATVTSLPELFSGIGCVTFHDLPDMAVGSTIGSCMFNLLVIAILDLIVKQGPVSLMVHQGHVLTAGFGIVLLGLAAIDNIFGKHLPAITALNSIDPLSIVILVTYALAMKLIFSYEAKRTKEFAGELFQELATNKTSLKKAALLFALNSLIITLAALRLPELGEQIGKLTGWGDSFIGSSLIAITTSLPELTVSIAAVRIGSFDMAVGNLLGSNLFNIAILAITDFFYLKAPLMRSVSEVNSLSAMISIIMSAIAVIGLTYRSNRKVLFAGWDSIFLFIFYLAGNALLFVATGLK